RRPDRRPDGRLRRAVLVRAVRPERARGGRHRRRARAQHALDRARDRQSSGLTGREMTKTLDVVCIGRSSVDLYGQQVGGRLEDMTSFAKYVGGCPTNIAIGAARLGLKPGLITAVGDEHMGRFIKEQAAAEGVDIRGVKTDPERLTALVILGIRDQHTFPLIFVRENCADAALTEDDVDEDYIAAARAVVVSGTHFSKPNLDAMSKK